MEKEFIPKKSFLKAEALELVREGKIDPAIEKYRQYLGLNPLDDDAWCGLGGAYRRKDVINQAINSYEKAYKINPQSTYALVNIVSLRAARHSKQDQEILEKTYLPEAIKLVKRIIEKGDGDHWTWYDLATVQLIQGDIEEARRTFNYAAELTPQTAKEHFRTVLNNLNFLKEHNPSIKGISDIIKIIKQHLD